MATFLLRRVFVALPVILGVFTVLFFALHAMPGDPVDTLIPRDIPSENREELIRNLGLDQPLYVQYLKTIEQLFTLQLKTFGTRRPVVEVIAEALPNTLILALASVAIAYVVGILLGIVQAVRQYSKLDTGITVVALVFYSMPGFWLALMLILAFALWWPVLPATGMHSPGWEFMPPGARRLDLLRHLVLPAATLSLASAAGVARYMRSSMLEVVRQDYVRTARAKGLRRSKVVFKHALRNALLPIVTLLGLELPALFSGAVLVETVFGWPGMGRQIVGAIFRQDFPVVLTNTFVFSSLVVLGSLLADLLYSVVDPRIRHG